MTTLEPQPNAAFWEALGTYMRQRIIEQVIIYPKQLQEEALALCSKLNQAYYAEDARRDSQFRRVADEVKLERLHSLWQKAADRWRRRIGQPPLYK